MVAALIAQLPDLPGEGPDDLSSLLRVCFILLGAGFVLGVLGHMTRSRTLVAVGVSVVMLGTVAFVFAVGRYG